MGEGKLCSDVGLPTEGYMGLSLFGGDLMDLLTSIGETITLEEYKQMHSYSRPYLKSARTYNPQRRFVHPALQWHRDVCHSPLAIIQQRD